MHPKHTPRDERKSIRFSTTRATTNQPTVCFFFCRVSARLPHRSMGSTPAYEQQTHMHHHQRSKSISVRTPPHYHRNHTHFASQHHGAAKERRRPRRRRRTAHTGQATRVCKKKRTNVRTSQLRLALQLVHQDLAFRLAPPSFALVEDFFVVPSSVHAVDSLVDSVGR